MTSVFGNFQLGVDAFGLSSTPSTWSPILLSDLFQMLSYGELSNLAMSGEASGTITTGAQPRIVNYLNEALLRLHTRFVLKEASLIVQMSDAITMYHLTPPYAASYVPPVGKAGQAVRYIMDSVSSPFTGDIVKILEVYNSWGRKVPLNDSEQMFSVFTPQTTVLQVPHPTFQHYCQPDPTVTTPPFLSLVYQAKHAKIVGGGDLSEQINIPDIILSALTSYIAYKVFSHMNTPDSTAKAQEYLGTYESICTEVTEKDLVNSSISTSNQLFCERGWI